jgi:hypothetical protein
MQEITNLLEYANQIPSLKSQVQQLYEDIQFEVKKKETFDYVLCLLDQQSGIEKSLNECQLNIDIKDTEDYKEIEKIAKQKANEILTDNKVMVSTALISVIEAIKINSNNNTGNAGLQYCQGQRVLTNGYCYFGSISFPIEETLKLAEKLFYQELSEMLSNALYLNRAISAFNTPRELPH